jgi:transmembrane 9 superfamily protein 2/4
MQRIREDYGLSFLIDGLPSSERKKTQSGEIFLDAQGFNL